jgi:replicative DNA helicase
MSKDHDDNDLLRTGELPEDPAAGTGPAPEPAREETPEEREARAQREAAAKAEALLDAEAATHLHPASAILASFPTRWESSPPPTSTGIEQFDQMLSGGLRAGDMVLVCAAAKGGKSALVGGIAYDFARPADARPRGLTIYASCEMSKEEIVARWITREAFALTHERRTPWMSHSAVLYGAAWRHEVTRDPTRNEALYRILLEAMERVASIVGPPDAPHVVITRALPGTTPWDLRRRVRVARARLPEGTPVLLVVDPLQRLFAGAQGVLSGRVLERANSEEAERVPRVAEQLKMIADEDGVALMCLSDTTKESVKSGSGSSAGMRGSYMLNHVATTLLGLHAAKDAATLAARLVEGGLADKSEKDALEQRLVDAVPPWFEHDTAVSELGRRYVFVDCSGNRNGPDDSLCLGYVRGAMTFVEADCVQV